MLKEMRVSRQAWRKVLPPLEKHSLMEIHTENDSGCVQAHCRSQLLFLHQRVPGALRSLEMQKRKKEESSSSLPRSLLLLGERWEVVRRVGVSCAAFYKATSCPETSLHLEPLAQPQAGQGACPGQRPGEDCACGCAAPNTRRLGSQRNPCLNAQIPPRHTPATVMGLLPQDHQTQPSQLPQHCLGSPCPYQPQPALSILHMGLVSGGQHCTGPVHPFSLATSLRAALRGGLHPRLLPAAPLGFSPEVYASALPLAADSAPRAKKPSCPAQLTSLQAQKLLPKSCGLQHYTHTHIRCNFRAFAELEHFLSPVLAARNKE